MSYAYVPRATSSGLVSWHMEEAAARRRWTAAGASGDDDAFEAAAAHLLSEEGWRFGGRRGLGTLDGVRRGPGGFGRGRLVVLARDQGGGQHTEKSNVSFHERRPWHETFQGSRARPMAPDHPQALAEMAESLGMSIRDAVLAYLDSGAPADEGAVQGEAAGQRPLAEPGPRPRRDRDSAAGIFAQLRRAVSPPDLGPQSVRFTS